MREEFVQVDFTDKPFGINVPLSIYNISILKKLYPLLTIFQAMRTNSFLIQFH